MIFTRREFCAGTAALAAPVFCPAGVAVTVALRLASVLVMAAGSFATVIVARESSRFFPVGVATFSAASCVRVVGGSSCAR